MADCIFCRIASGETPAQVVHRDEDVVAFRDVNPQAPTHLLVIPRAHIPSVTGLADSDEGLWWAMLATARALAASEGIDRSGFRLVINAGREAGQTVDHLHLHLLGGRPLSWPPG